MSEVNLDTPNTWCPGCGNFAIESASKQVIEEMGRENFALTAGIGCHGKMLDYIDTNIFYGLHGRPVCLASGIKVGNPDLNVVAYTGDGDSLNEGVSHLVHAAKKNSNITVVLHQNQNFALTVKQYTASSPKGFVSNSTPEGSVEEPLNALELVHSAGASFIARSFSGDPSHLKETLREAIEHQGFSFIEVMQPCVTWYNNLQEVQEKSYKMEDIPENPLEKIKEWDYKPYEETEKIPLGIFKKEEKPVFEQEIRTGGKSFDLKEVLDSKV